MGRKILLADDSVTIQKVVELTFMDQDFEVLAVSNGDEALSRFDDWGPDLVIADVHMPGANGYDVCREAKSRRPGIPVLLLVGTFEPFDENDAHAAGAERFLKKPFDSQQLLALAGELLAAADAAPEGEADEEASTSGLSGASDEEETSEAGEEEEASEASDEEETSDASFENEEESLSEAHPEDLPEISATAFSLGEDTGDDLDAMAPPESGESESDELDEVEPEFEAISDEEAPEGADTVEEEGAAAAFSLGFDVEDDELEPAAELEEESEEDEGGEEEESSDDANVIVDASEEDDSSEAMEAASSANGLSEEDVERVARRVVELMADTAVRDVAWDILPDLAEVVIRERLRELESQLD